MGTQVVLLGFPLGHTISPTMVQAAFDYFDLPVVYRAWPVPPDDLPAAIQNLRGPEYLGANVTVPYKERVGGFLDDIDPVALRVGAVNCIVKRNGRLIGHNTDISGFATALERDAGFDAYHKHVVILGAGGAARAVLVALADAEVGQLTIVNRDRSRSEQLVAAFRKEFPAGSLVSMGFSDTALGDTLSQCELLVNATPVGTSGFPTANSLPVDVALLPSQSVVFDLVYNPPVTMLLAKAAQRGLRTSNGMSMLVYQGAKAFELWTGEKPPIGLMMERAKRALSQDTTTT